MAAVLFSFAELVLCMTSPDRMLAAADDRDANLREIFVSVPLGSSQSSAKSLGLRVRIDPDLQLVPLL